MYYDKKNKFKKKKESIKNNDLFFKYIEFIKSTGIHSGDGFLLYNNFPKIIFKYKKIHNTHIFKSIKKFFIYEK